MYVSYTDCDISRTDNSSTTAYSSTADTIHFHAPTTNRMVYSTINSAATVEGVAELPPSVPVWAPEIVAVEAHERNSGKVLSGIHRMFPRQAPRLEARHTPTRNWHRP